MKVEAGRLVEIEYRIYTADGELFESSEDESVVFVQGDGDLLPGLEAALEGREAGADFEVTLGPDEAYGPYDPEGIVSVPRNELPDDMELAAGEFITVVVQEDEDDEDSTGEMEMRIVEVNDEELILDGNHPLAGAEVRFELKVLGVREAE